MKKPEFFIICIIFIFLFLGEMPLTRLARRYHRNKANDYHTNPENHIDIISQLEEEMSEVVLTQSCGKFSLFLTFFYNESLLL